MWRPEDLKNPFSPAAITVRNVFGDKPISHYEAFEYGADAMLEALREKGLKVTNFGDLPQGKGLIIFIPEEPK